MYIGGIENFEKKNLKKSPVAKVTVKNCKFLGFSDSHPG